MINSQILVINYVMDDLDRVLSHQAEIVRNLSKNFNQIVVLTGRVGKVSVPANVDLISYNWQPQSKLKNIITLFTVSYKVMRENKFKAVFSHMTLEQAVIVLPLTKFFGLKHYLWYAHKRQNYRLNLFYKFFSGIITSTKGSCPLVGKNIFAIGQSIDSKKFNPDRKLIFPIINLVHVGRFDPVKRIPEIIDAVSKAKVNFPRLQLSIIGSPSSIDSQIYARKVQSEFASYIKNGWLAFSPGVSRSELPELYKFAGAFIHSCDEALDKVTLEANLSRLPVVTNNLEYLGNFGYWSDNTVRSDGLLLSELLALLNQDESAIKNKLDDRYEKTIRHHELDGWISRLVEIINA